MTAQEILRSAPEDTLRDAVALATARPEVLAQLRRLYGVSLDEATAYVLDREAAWPSIQRGYVARQCKEGVRSQR